VCYIFISLLKPEKAIFSLTNQKKNDLVILASFIRPPGEVYGSEIRFLRTVKTLRKLNTEIIPITNGRLVSKITNLVQERYVVPLHLPRSLSKRLLDYYYVMKTIISILIKPPKFDLTLALDGNLMDMLASFLISYLLRKPFVVMMNLVGKEDSLNFKDLPRLISKRGVVNAYLKMFSHIVKRFVAQRTALIVAVGSATKDEYAKCWQLLPSRILVTSNGPNVVLGEARPVKDREIDVLYVGRFTQSKGVYLLPYICDQLKKTHPNIKMVAVGGLAKDIVAMKDKVAKLSLLNNLEIREYMSDTQLGKIMENSKIFVNPSYRETFSIVTLEAMSAGCVCVISDIESLRRLYSGISLFARVGDASDFAQVISSLLDSPNEMERMSRRSEEFSKLFDWDRIIQRELSVYKNIVYKNKGFIHK
jgi:glycosyltransferase involved in cell wall biosynthesis